MKYLKAYETIISLDLDEEDQKNLMIQAIENNKTSLIKELLKNGFNPNTKITYHLYISEVPLLLIESGKKLPNLEIIQLLIDYGANVNLINNDWPIIYQIIYNSNRLIKKPILLEIIKKFIKAGANLLFINKDRGNFFDIIKKKTEWKDFTQKFEDQLFDMIKIEAPEQYKKYLIEKDIKKYNL